MSGYLLKWGVCKPGWSILSHLKKQYRNDAISKPAVLETLMSVPSLSDHYRPELGYKLPELKFKEDSYILKAYAAAKKLNPALDHRAYNETLDVQINLMKKGMPAQLAGRLATAQILMEQRVATLENEYRHRQAEEYTADPVARRRTDWQQRRQREKIAKLKFIFETIVHTLRADPEGALSTRLTADDIKAHLNDPTLTDLELHEAIERYPDILQYLHVDLREAVREFTPHYFRGLRAVRVSKHAGSRTDDVGTLDLDSEIPEEHKMAMLEEHNETKAEAEKQAGIESASAAAQEPMDEDFDELDKKAKAARAKEMTQKYRQQKQERLAKKRTRK